MASYQVSHAAVDQAYVRLEQREYASAEILLVEGMHKAEGIRDAHGRTESRVRCQVALARLKGATGDAAERSETLRLALQVGENGGLEENRWMMLDTRASFDE